MAAAFQQSNASFLRVEINLVKVCIGLWLAADSPLPSSCLSRRFWVTAPGGLWIRIASISSKRPIFL